MMPKIRPITCMPVWPSKRSSAPAISSKPRVTRRTSPIMPRITAWAASRSGCALTSTITAVMLAGPAIIGMASGNTAMRSAAAASSVGAMAEARSAGSMTNWMASSKSRMPPPTRSADRLMPRIRRRSSPQRPKTIRIMVAISVPLRAVVCRARAVQPWVNAENTGAALDRGDGGEEGGEGGERDLIQRRISGHERARNSIPRGAGSNVGSPSSPGNARWPGGGRGSLPFPRRHPPRSWVGGSSQQLGSGGHKPLPDFIGWHRRDIDELFRFRDQAGVHVLDESDVDRVGMANPRPLLSLIHAKKHHGVAVIDHQHLVVDVGTEPELVAVRVTKIVPTAVDVVDNGLDR